jgi:GNAT superfamily N-acetyltransferase
MAGLIVRRVNACDRAIASEVNRLQRLTLPSDSPCTLAGAMWWLVYDGSQPVAFAGLRRSAQFCDAGYLCRAGVAASHRGQGLQRRLIQVRENQARKSGWKWLLTDTYCNPPSANNLIARGFKQYTPSVPWAAEAATYWLKKL